MLQKASSLTMIILVVGIEQGRALPCFLVSIHVELEMIAWLGLLMFHLFQPSCQGERYQGQRALDIGLETVISLFQLDLLF